MAVGYPIFDPIAGSIVSLLVIHQGVDISRENIQYLADSAPPELEQEKNQTADSRALRRSRDSRFRRVLLRAHGRG